MEPNIRVGGKPEHFDFAQSIDDLIITCGSCGERMKVRGEEIACQCGNHENANELFEELRIVGPAKGYEVTLHPEDVGMAK